MKTPFLPLCMLFDISSMKGGIVMKNRLVRWGLLCLCVSLMVSGLPAPKVKANSNVIHVFDLESEINNIHSNNNSQMAYDYLKLATALQGIVNRAETKLYYYYKSNYIANYKSLDPDEFWMEELQKTGKAFASNTLVTETTFMQLLDIFEDEYEGVVVWDSEVPATSNVASTIAGVENLLPVRYDLTQGSPYDVLVNDLGLPVVVNLKGKFTGTGTIPDTALSSTGSPKNDAYLWAKVHYLDTGLTNPLMMVYALDGMSWGANEFTNNLSSQVVNAKIPSKVKAGTQAQLQIEVKNTGNYSWSYAANDRLAAASTNQFTWTNFTDGGYSIGATNQRVYLTGSETVQSGKKKMFTFDITAPASPGIYTFSVQMVRDGAAWHTQSFTRTIEVISGTPATSAFMQPVLEHITYDDLFNSFLPNADYFIANKAFFFDLSPDAGSRPNDDRTQPLGTDYATLIKLLRSQNAIAGDHIITVGGFVPWWLKYTKHIDPAASYEPVQAEWMYADIISKYNAQKDADAYGLVGLSNASAFQHVPLQASYTQNNDKGANGTLFDNSKKYVVFYMGDYDSGAWTSSALPALWNDPKRGQLPLAWSLVPGLSQRVPQLFNYIYETMSTKDYIVTGDNGAGYLNPMMLMSANRPDNLPDFLHVWEEYNTEYYRLFDIDITGFLISGNSGSVHSTVQQAYSRISPVGVGTNAGYASAIVNGTPYFTSTDLGVDVRNAAVYGEMLKNALTGSKKFYMFRNILMQPSILVDAVNYVKTNYPSIQFEVVDPYTFFRFNKAHTLGQTTTVLNAQTLYADIPEKMSAGQTVDVEITVWNTGTNTWSYSSMDRWASLTGNELTWTNLNGGYSSAPNNQRVFMNSGQSIIPGQQKTFHFSITAPSSPGAYTFSARMVRDGAMFYGDTLTRTIQVISP